MVPAPAPPPAKQAAKFPPPTPKPVAPPLWLSGQLPPTPKFSSTSGNGGGYGGVRGGGWQGWRGGRGRAPRPRPRRQPGKELIMRSSETKKVIFRYESINLNVFNCVVKSLKITTKSGLTDLSIPFLYRKIETSNTEINYP
jgi:hypothetical protein